MTKQQMPYDGIKSFSSISGAGTTGHPHAKTWIEKQTLESPEKLTQNGSLITWKTQHCKTWR